MVEICKPRKHKKICREIIEASSTEHVVECKLKPKKCRVETQVCDEGSEEVITTKECLKPKKHKRCVVEVAQSSTTNEVVEECIKPKKHKTKEVRIDGPV